MFETAFIDLPPLRGASGRVALPGSKSISNRVLLLAGLASGTTRILGLLDSDDTKVMLDALRTLGCGIERQHDEHPHDEQPRDVLLLTGIGGRLVRRDASLFLGNAGTAMRPLTASLALLAASQNGRFELSGVARMHERPIGDLVDALRQLGCAVDYLGVDGYPPLRLRSLGAALRTDRPIRVRGDVSSQFLTALLLALPLVAADTDLVVEVEGELISKPYVEITLNLLARFGIAVQRDGWQRFTVPRGSRYVSPGEIHVEADASSASYFIALGALAATDAPLRIDGVGADSIQGDIRFVDAARAMGADITTGANWLEVRRGRFPLQSIERDCNEIPDAAMTLAVLALYASGTTRLTNIASWRVKETDRIAAMANELRKLGATVETGADWIAVTPPTPTAWRAATIATYDDHRIAMCFSLAAFNPLVSGDAGVPVRIVDPRCVGKTFPDYFETFFERVHTPVEAIPVITVDGPTASGKGTLAGAVAQALGYHFLDSGAVYRATALASLRAGIAADDEAGLTELTRTLDLRFVAGRAMAHGEDVSDILRLEEIGALASRVSAFAAVREALRELQLSFRRVPGLVADGRDMGTVIFPGAQLKVFLTAGAATRAERRYRQLIDKGLSANIATLRGELEARDARDQNRSTSPLKPAADAMLLDNSALGVDDSVQAVLDAWQQRGPFAREPSS